MKWIAQYQTVQETVDRVTLSICPIGRPDSDALDGMLRHGKEMLSPDVTFEIRLTDALLAEPSGKIQSSISLVREQDQ